MQTKVGIFISHYKTIVRVYRQKLAQLTLIEKAIVREYLGWDNSLLQQAVTCRQVTPDLLVRDSLLLWVNNVSTLFLVCSPLNLRMQRAGR